MRGPIEKMIPEYKDLMFNLKRDVIDTLTARHTSTAETQTMSKLAIFLFYVYGSNVLGINFANLTEKIGA